MKNNAPILFTALFFIFSQNMFGQLVLHANTDVLSIKDGEKMRTDYWTVSPENELDIYRADKTGEIKTVTFYSDIDSLSFEIKPRDKFDFIVLLNGKDTCRHRIESGITFQKTDDMEYTTDTIPFTLTAANNISIQGVINGVDTVDLMFHTAANSVALIENSTEKMTSLDFGKTIGGVEAWGGEGTMRYAVNNSLKIGNFKWDNLKIWEDKHSGPGTDGKFGPNFFQDKVIEILFDKNIMVIHSLPPEIDKAYEKFNLIYNQEMMFLEGTSEVDGIEYKNTFLIHSGYSGALLFDDEFVSENNIGDKLEVTKESELKDSFGNVLKTKEATLPVFKLGNISLSETPVSFFEGSIRRQKMSVMGGNLLKRFNMIIDLQNAFVYLKPNANYDMAFSE